MSPCLNLLGLLASASFFCSISHCLYLNLSLSVSFYQSLSLLLSVSLSLDHCEFSTPSHAHRNVSEISSLHTFTMILVIMDARTSVRSCKKWWSTWGSGRQQPQDLEEALSCPERSCWWPYWDELGCLRPHVQLLIRLGEPRSETICLEGVQIIAGTRMLPKGARNWLQALLIR
jgi:hypothetical protein